MKDKLKTALGCILFGGIFGAVGVFASWVIVTSVYDGYRARDWVLTSAMVESWDTTAVTYRYKVGDQEFTGDRLGSMVLNGKDSLDSWHDDIDALLTTAKNEKKPIMVRVNPDNPRESMINADIRWAPLVFFVPFALGFGGVGLGALVMLFRTFVPARGGSGTGTNLMTTWFFTIMWNAIAMPIAFLFVPRMIDEGEWVGLFVLIFPLIGVLLLWGALWATWKAAVGVVKQIGSPSARGHDLDMKKKAKDLSAEEMLQVRKMAEKKKPKMVESDPEVLREHEQPNGERPAMVGVVEAALPDGASRRLAQADAEEAEAALRPKVAKVAPELVRMYDFSKEKREALVKKVGGATNLVFWIVIAIIFYRTGVFGEVYHLVVNLVQGNAAP